MSDDSYKPKPTPVPSKAPPPTIVTTLWDIARWVIKEEALMRVVMALGGNALKMAVKSFTAGVDSAEPLATQATPGREPELAHLRSVVGLVWRCVVLWMVLLALLTLARLLG